MQVWNVLYAARWKYRTQKWRKKSPSAHHRTTCRTVSSQPRRLSTIGKKLVKQQYVIHMSARYGELRPTNGWDRFGSLRHTSKFQWIRLAFVTAAKSLTGGQPNFARCLAVSWAGTLYLYTFSGAVVPCQNFVRAKFTLRPSLAFAYIGSVTARHSSSWRQPNCSVIQGMELRNGATYIRQGGHHVGHRPTF